MKGVCFFADMVLYPPVFVRYNDVIRFSMQKGDLMTANSRQTDDELLTDISGGWAAAAAYDSAAGFKALPKG